MRDLIRFTLLFFISLDAFSQSAPTLSIVNTGSLSCTNQPVTFLAKSNQSGFTYTWTISPARGFSHTDANSNPITFTFSLNLTYTLGLVAANENGIASTTLAVPVSKTARAAFNASLDMVGYPSHLTLTNYSSNYIASYWTFSDGSGIDSSTNVYKGYISPGAYTVNLLAKGARGCNDAASYAFVIPRNSSVTLPNIFTPNNDDINEVYKPILEGIAQLKARVYNRDGALVTSWDRVNGFWDGYTFSGEHCPDGQYFIVVEAVGFDGQNYKLKSAITLAR